MGIGVVLHAATCTLSQNVHKLVEEIAHSK